MIAYTSRSLALAMVTIFAACSSNPAPEAAPTSDASSDCSRSASADGAVWKAVVADRFAFCIPPDWQSASRNTWDGDGGSIAFFGSEQPRGPFVVAAVPGQMPTDVWERTETINGARIKLRRSRLGSTYYTGAVSSSPRFSLTGVAPTRTAAERHIEIYRTIHQLPAVR
jgi:hypothetical protein